jgi:20S proteasome alpha/beta subunit
MYTTKQLHLFVIVVALFLAACVPSIQAAHSRARTRFVFSKEKDYDRTTSSFSSEGRLMQIEYGFESAKRASTATVINLGALEGDSNDAILVIVRSGDKIVRLSLDDELWLVTTGLAGDGNFLATLLRRFCQDFRIQYGEPSTVREVAQQAAGLQHQLTMLETYRPLGLTAILVGIDPRERKPTVFRTDPGGILEERPFVSAGKVGDLVTKELAKQWQQLENKGESKDALEKLLHAAISSHGLEEDSEGFDVWIIQPNPPGKASVRCYLGVTKENCHKVATNEAGKS